MFVVVQMATQLLCVIPMITHIFFLCGFNCNTFVSYGFNGNTNFVCGGPMVIHHFFVGSNGSIFCR